MKQIRRRFITSAMSALLILLVLIVGSIMIVSYTQMEQQGEAFIQETLNEQVSFSAFSPDHGPRTQPGQRRVPSGYYDIMFPKAWGSVDFQHFPLFLLLTCY